MVFSKSEKEHVTHASTALARLRANNLFAKASKCLSHVSSVEYLGYVFSPEGLKMDQAKVQKILNWPFPRNLKAIQSFLGFANFYRCFIKNYSKRISSLASFLKKDSCFPLNEEALKIVASDYALGAVLSQVSDSGAHPIAFDSHNLIPAELNYDIPENSLQYFMSSKFLTRCQARWAGFLSEFHFSITYRPGRLATLPDALSRWDHVYPERGEDFISKNLMNFQQLIKQDEVQRSRYFAVKVEYFSNLIE
ncbi:hypothetical protein O181_108824 [Austropuccinia psidii MF-1]|uniref:Reverse transcriptase RNase H-like domain-containing protein n=1 Tax=Austropuccinia psidii MF-1 TaxID=1389203 RepID=A0A9Q3JWV4_9BASI|nr:hypothetical protein [Austropuccinia psidii MF-1]